MEKDCDISLINQVLHYSKTVPFSKTFHNIAKDSKEWCPFLHGKRINNTCYKANPAMQNFLAWLHKYIVSCKFLDCDRYAIDDLNSIYTKLSNPELIANYEDFREEVSRLKSIVRSLESSLHQRIELLTCTECIRLDEALVCFKNFSFHASVIMAVSAVEDRIAELIKRMSKRLYMSTFSKFTLGQLIQVFDNKQYTDKKYKKIKSLMPEKHKPLVVLLNQYRIFSAHPKGEIITAQIAEAILHLAFAFMIDKKTSPYSKKERKCNK